MEKLLIKKIKKRSTKKWENVQPTNSQFVEAIGNKLTPCERRMLDVAVTRNIPKSRAKELAIAMSRAINGRQVDLPSEFLNVASNYDLALKQAKQAIEQADRAMTRLVALAEQYRATGEFANFFSEHGGSVSPRFIVGEFKGMSLTKSVAPQLRTLDLEQSAVTTILAEKPGPRQSKDKQTIFGALDGWVSVMGSVPSRVQVTTFKMLLKIATDKHDFDDRVIHKTLSEARQKWKKEQLMFHAPWEGASAQR